MNCMEIIFLNIYSGNFYYAYVIVFSHSSCCFLKWSWLALQCSVWIPLHLSHFLLQIYSVILIYIFGWMSSLLWICRVMIFNSFYGLLKLSNNFFSFSPGLDVRKILHLWPLHAFKKLIIFGVCLPCPSTGLWSYKLECGVWTSGILCFFYPVLYHPLTNILFAFCMWH